MKQSDIDIFNSKIDKRLSDAEWSRDIAVAVVKKDRSAGMDFAIRIFSWVMPALAAASIMYVVFFSSAFTDLFIKEQVQTESSSFISEIYGVDDSPVEDMF